MKIIINTASTYKGGGVQVARSFIEECKQFNEHEYHVIMGEMISSQIDQHEYPNNFTFYSIGYRPATRVLSLRSADRDLREIENKVNPDVVFTTSGPAYWRPKAPHLVGYNLPHYVYMDSPFFTQIPYHQRIKWYLKGTFIKYFFQRDADAYVVQTDDVNQRLQKLFQTDRVYTVSNTYSQFYDNPKHVRDKLPARTNGEFRFLTLSAWHTHKNLKVITKVLQVLPDHIKEKLRFVLTLPDETYQSNFPAEVANYIINVGPVKPDEGPALYEECDALFLPTLLECFSASYAEAMKMEKPILTSDLGFAHTVCGDAALYFDPVEPHAISEKIIDLIENVPLRKNLVQEGIKQQQIFATAGERAKEYLRICKELTNGQKKRK